MEKLAQDLFNDPTLEADTKSEAGAVFQPIRICATAIGGGSTCITGGGADASFDPQQ